MVALQARFTVEPALIFERSDFGDTPDMSVARGSVSDAKKLMSNN